jgi:DHA3 family macrolide efflux protein-like MFS transporter
MSTVVTANKQTFRNYMQFFIGQLISMLGSNILSFVMIWWVTVNYENPIYLSLIYFFAVGTRVIVNPIGGVFADRWNRKKIIIVADSLIVLCSLCFFIIMTFQSSMGEMTTLWLIIVVVFFSAIIGAFQGPAVFSIIPLMIPKEKLSRVNGLRFVLFGAITIIGPAVGAILYDLWPINYIILIDVLTWALALTPLILLKIPPTPREEKLKPAEKKPSFLTEFREGLRYMRKIKGLLALALIATFINGFEQPLFTLRPAFIKYLHEGSATDLAIVVAAGQAAMFTSGLFLTIKKEWKKHTVILMIALYIQIAGILLQSLAPVGMIWFIAMGAAVTSLTFPFTNVMIQTIFQIVIAPDKQGRVGSIVGSIASAITPVAMLVSGPIANAIGYVPLFVGSISIGGVIITALWIFTDLGNLDLQVEEIKERERKIKELEEQIPVEKIETQDVPTSVLSSED